MLPVQSALIVQGEAVGRLSDASSKATQYVLDYVLSQAQSSLFKRTIF